MKCSWFERSQDRSVLATNGCSLAAGGRFRSRDRQQRVEHAVQWLAQSHRQVLDRALRVLECETRVGDALSIRQANGAEVLSPAHEMAFDHQRLESNLAGQSLRKYALDHFKLALRTLLAVAVTAIDHQDFRQI